MPTDESTASLPPRTIQEQMIQNGISFSFSDQDYHACLAVMNCVLGFKPTMNQFAKVWEPGFWTFHLMFKNSMNLPFSMLGIEPDIQDLFLVLYASSREGGCDYCTAHSVGLALRTGALPEKIVCEGSNKQRDKSLYTIARALSRFPADLCTSEIIDLKRFFTTDKIEWIVLTIAAGGYLNILGLAGGLALEEESSAEQALLIKETGWENKHVDAQQQNVNVENAHIPNPQLLSILLKATRHMPSAIIEETKWTFGVPMTWPKVGTYLMEQVGYNFPLLKYLSHFRIITVTYGCIMRDNFKPEDTSIGIINKCLIQAMFATYFSDQLLQDDAETLVDAMAKRNGVAVPGDEIYEAIDDMSRQDSDPPATKDECHALLDSLQDVPGIDTRENAAVLILARAVMQRPTHVEPAIVQEVSSLLTSAQSCEVVHWVGMMVAFHRALRFYDVKGNTPAELWETNGPVDLSIKSQDDGSAVEEEFDHSNDITSAGSGRKTLSKRRERRTSVVSVIFGLKSKKKKQGDD